jgi:Glycosyl hydrolases family 2
VSNRIRSIHLRDASLVPAEAVVHVVVFPERIDAGTQVRGRLMGPRCRFASTVEVAYHLRQLSASADSVTLRAVIPEASFWDPQSPHLYAGPVELWQDGQRVEAITVRHGLRHLTLGPRGLRVNGRLLALRGRRVTGLDDTAALALRESGYNLVVVPVKEETKAIWEVADRIGLFVLGRLEGEAGLRGVLSGHPSCLGWLKGDDGVLVGETEASFVARASGQGNGDRPALLLDAPAGQGGDAVLGVVEGM